MHRKQDLVKLWANGEKRKAFIQDYKAWGVWFPQTELSLTFYKCDLPDGSRIIAMEYLREPYYGEKTDGGPETGLKYYLQKGEYFNPSSVSGSTMYEHLMHLKEDMAKELRQKA